MISENILLFPTLITLGKREVDELEKESWFSAYLEMSDEDGKSMDYLGYQSIHHDKRFMKVFSDVADTIRNHLKTLGVDIEIIDIHITKSWFNVKKEHGNPIHNHAENHLSFTYYPHLRQDKQLVFYQDRNKVNNDVYEDFLESNVNEWYDINATSYSLPVREGNIFVFPSRLLHGVGTKHKETSLESFKNRDDLESSRFCVGGDAILTRKDTKGYNKLLTPIENWRKF